MRFLLLLLFISGAVKPNIQTADQVRRAYSAGRQLGLLARPIANEMTKGLGSP